MVAPVEIVQGFAELEARAVRGHLVLDVSVYSDSCGTCGDTVRLEADDLYRFLENPRAFVAHALGFDSEEQMTQWERDLSGLWCAGKKADGTRCSRNTGQVDRCDWLRVKGIWFCKQHQPPSAS